ncbi:hypothetical protein FOZ62_016538, partial [Perkinsus olseni]
SHTPTYERRELTKEDRAEVEASIKVRLGMLPAPAQIGNKDDSSPSSKEKSVSRSPSPMRESCSEAEQTTGQEDAASDANNSNRSGRPSSRGGSCNEASESSPARRTDG